MSCRLELMSIVSTGYLKFSVKKMKPRIAKGILRRKCEMNMGSKTYRLASRLGRAVFELFSKFITPGCSKCAIGGTDHVGIF